MLLRDIVDVSAQVAADPGRLVKIDLLAGALRLLDPEEIPIGVALLTGVLRQGRLGVGYASLRGPVEPAMQATLSLREVDSRLTALSRVAGPGSKAQRRRLLDELLGRATQPEQDFLVGLVLGELRQGALEGVMVEAVAQAAAVPATSVRRALMLSGDLGSAAQAALTGGQARLTAFRLQLLRPLQPMLAQTSDGVADAFARICPAAVEWKLDGARIQLHRRAEEVRVFTRNLADITDRVPEVVEAARSLPSVSLVLDGEVLALDEGGRPRPFQVTMSRFGSKLEVDELRSALPLAPSFFDCLHLDGADLLDQPSAQRWGALADAVPARFLVPRIVAERAPQAVEFLEEALAAGHEGVMVKSLDAPYLAGRRGSAWLKVKPVHTLDLVVLAVEWGSGRRQGRLSNLHLGARDAESGEFVMLGKTFKGLTDEMLDWQTRRFLELETHREGHVVYVRPEQVVEVAFDGVQRSSRYPGGMALRFARVKGYREDKSPAEADTIDTVRAIFRR